MNVLFIVNMYSVYSQLLLLTKAPTLGPAK